MLRKGYFNVPFSVCCDLIAGEAMGKRATLGDVASAVGVSVSTASRILNGKDFRVSDETRKRVLEAAKQMNYVPNQIARGLSARRSGTMGLVLPSIESRRFTALTQSLQGLCERHGIGLFVMNSHNVVQGDLSSLEMLVRRGVDGIFIVPSNLSYSDETVAAAIDRSPVPCVLVARSLESTPCDTVIFDSELGGYLATSFLINHGHRNIVCITDFQESRTGAQRANGYRRALREAGLHGERVIQSSYTMPGGYVACNEAVDGGITAIFAGSDYIALGARKALGERKIAVPDQCSLVSCDLSESDFLFDPQMTTVMQDMGELGDQSFSCMCGRISGDGSSPRTLMIQPELRIGKTVAQI